MTLIEAVVQMSILIIQDIMNVKIKLESFKLKSCVHVGPFEKTLNKFNNSIIHHKKA